MHKIKMLTGGGGWYTELECPEECDEKEAHQEQWSDVGVELVLYSDNPVVLAEIEVEPEWTGVGEDAELWLNPVVQED